MNIAIRITSFCGLIAAFVLGLISPTQITAAERPPNVVVIFMDDMGYADIGPFGATAYPTPHLDRMAKEGMKLTDRDLQQLAGASGNFVNLPDAGWVQLDQKAVQDAQEAMAALGLAGLSAVEQKIGIEQAAHLDDDGFAKFVPSEELKQLRGRLDEFEGVESTDLPDGICAEMRPYQLDGFSFLCHLAKLKLGGILDDEMGLGSKGMPRIRTYEVTNTCLLYTSPSPRD